MVFDQDIHIQSRDYFFMLFFGGLEVGSKNNNKQIY